MSQEILLPVMMIVIAISLYLLKKDSQKISSAHNITAIYMDNLGKISVASKVEDAENRGAKTLLIAYSLTCRHCESKEVFIDLSEDKSQLEIICRECGYVSRIPLVDIFPK